MRWVHSKLSLNFIIIYLFIYLLFLPYCVVFGILVPWPQTEPAPPEVEA